jgi:hypothetical protein
VVREALGAGGQEQEATGGEDVDHPVDGTSPVLGVLREQKPPRRKNPLDEATPGFDDRAQSLALGDTYILSANMVNSLRASVNRIASLKLGANMFGAPEVGIGCALRSAPCSNSNYFSYLPNYLQMVVTGNFTLGGTTKYAFDYETSFGVNDDFSIVHGSHLFAFGGYYNRAITWLLAQAFADEFVRRGGTVVDQFQYTSDAPALMKLRDSIHRIVPLGRTTRYSERSSWRRLARAWWRRARN